MEYEKEMKVIVGEFDYFIRKCLDGIKLSKAGKIIDLARKVSDEASASTVEILESSCAFCNLGIY